MYKLIKVSIVILLASAAVRAQTPECNLTADWEYNSLGNATGTYRVWLANDNTPNCAANPLSQVSKPIIIAGGWDPTNDWDEMNIYINDLNTNRGLNLMDQLHDEGFDIIVMDYDEGAAHIQQNAYLLATLIDDVNVNKTGNEECVVMGLSMGGLVVRYALATMESQAWMNDHNSRSHDSRLAVYYDSPHKGAFVPYALHHITEKLLDAADDAVDLLNDVNTVNNITAQVQAIEDIAEAVEDLEDEMMAPTASASQQMLIGHYLSTAQDLKDDFYDELSTLGDYPSNCRNIAVSNGSIGGIDQGFELNDQLFEVNADRDLLDFQFDMYATQGLYKYTTGLYPVYARYEGEI